MNRRALISLFAAGALLRAWWLVVFLADPSTRFPHGNTGGFIRLARLILEGDLLAGDRPFFYGPLYAYFLAPCFALTGDESLLLPRVLQSLLGLLLALLTWELARRTFDEKAAAFSCALMLFYGPGLFFEGLAVATTLSTVLLMLSLVLISRAMDQAGAVKAGAAPLVQLAFAGAAIGLCCWGRGNVLLLLPPAALWILWRSGGERLRRVLPVAAFTLGACALILPVAARNALVGGDRVLLVSQGGLNFFCGNNPESPGFFSPPEGAGLVDDSDEAWEANSRAVAEADLGRELKPSEVSSYWFGRGLDWMAEHPGEAAALWWTKLRLLLDPYEIPIHRNAQVFLGEFPLPLPGWAALLALAATGLLAGGVGSDRRGLLLLLALVYAGTVVAFFVVDRYRFPLVPLLAPFAGLACARLPLLWTASEERGRSLAVALAGAAAWALLHLAPSAIGEEVRGRYEALELHRRAQAWERLGEPGLALETYEDALAAAPGHVPSRLRQCELLLDEGRAEEAIDILRKLLSVAPGLEEVQELLARAEARLQE